MKKRKICVKKILLFVIILIIIGFFAFFGINYLKSDKKSEHQTKIVDDKEKQPIIEEPKEKRMSLVAVGDALIHGAVYQDAYIGNNNYDFSPMFTSIAPLIKDYDLRYYNQETIIGGKDLGISHYPTFNSPD